MVGLLVTYVTRRACKRQFAGLLLQVPVRFTLKWSGMPVADPVALNF